MLLNRFEYALMNNPIRAAIQRRFEAARLLEMGGRVNGGAALELGCGRGVGAELVLDVFGARSVDAFDLDPSMVDHARARLKCRGNSVRLWVGDATAVPSRDSTYDAVFDFGIVHHVPSWEKALQEVSRVLKPGGRFYAEEVLATFIDNRVIRWCFRHPESNRFGRQRFREVLGDVGLVPQASMDLWGVIAWFIANKPGAAADP